MHQRKIQKLKPVSRDFDYVILIRHVRLSELLDAIPMTLSTSSISIVYSTLHSHCLIITL